MSSLLSRPAIIDQTLDIISGKDATTDTLIISLNPWRKLQKIFKEMYAGVHKSVSNFSSAIACVLMQTSIINQYELQAHWIHNGNLVMLGALLFGMMPES